MSEAMPVYSSTSGPVYPGLICRFCSTRDKDKNYIQREANNVWSATICDDCVDACARALKALRKKQV